MGFSLTIDDIYCAIVPPEYRLPEDGEISEEERKNLLRLMAHHQSAIDEILDEMVNAIATHYKENPAGCDEELRKFDGNLLCVANRLMEEECVDVAIDLAAFVAKNGTDNEGSKKIFQRYDRDVRETIESCQQFDSHFVKAPGKDFQKEWQASFDRLGTPADEQLLRNARFFASIVGDAEIICRTSIKEFSAQKAMDKPAMWDGLGTPEDEIFLRSSAPISSQMREEETGLPHQQTLESVDEEEDGDEENGLYVLRGATSTLFRAAAKVSCDHPIAGDLRKLCVEYAEELFKKDVDGYLGIMEGFANKTALNDTYPGGVAIIEAAYDDADLRTGWEIEGHLKSGNKPEALAKGFKMLAVGYMMFVKYHDTTSVAARAEQSFEKYFQIVRGIRPDLANDYLKTTREICAAEAANDEHEGLRAGFQKMKGLVERLPSRAGAGRSQAPSVSLALPLAHMN